MATYDLHPLWFIDEKWYKQQYPDVAAVGYSAFYHYLAYGRFEGRQPNPLFDLQWYKSYLPLPAIDPVKHYLTLGWTLKLEPCQHFFSMIDRFSKSMSTLVENELLTSTLLNNETQSPLEILMRSPYYQPFLSYYKSLKTNGTVLMHHPSVLPNYTLPSSTMIQPVPSSSLSSLSSTMMNHSSKLDTTHGDLSTMIGNEPTNSHAPSTKTIDEVPSRVAVVYLLPVHAKYVGDFQLWLASFLQHQITDHTSFDLFVILKKMDVKDTDEKCVADAWRLFPQLVMIRPILIVHENTGMDIGSWIKFSRDYAHHYNLALFMSTYTIIHCDAWLSLFTNIFDRHPNLALLGASGSHEKMPTMRNVSYPNIHIRTGGFMCRLKDMNHFDFGSIETKQDCYEYEHGLLSLTRRMRTLGLVGIVGRDGDFYTPRKWTTSNIGQYGNYSNTILSDFQIYQKTIRLEPDLYSKMIQYPPQQEWYDDEDDIIPPCE